MKALSTMMMDSWKKGSNKRKEKQLPIFRQKRTQHFRNKMMEHPNQAKMINRISIAMNS